MNTREAELAMLIAEQEKDDTLRVEQSHLSLDRPIGKDPAAVLNLHGVVGDEDAELIAAAGGYDSELRVVRDTRNHGFVTDAQVASWWYDHHRRRLSKYEIARRAGVSEMTVRYHLKKRKYRVTERSARLEAKLEVLRRVYEDGARLIDIASEVYAEVGYGSAESCYQALRKLFIARKVPLRPKSWKHGHRSRTANRDEYESYWRTQNARAKERRRAALSRCPAITKDGRRCKRFAIQGRAFCVNHNADTRRAAKWAADAICDALRAWSAANGTKPKPRDWTHATAEHPSFKTVYNVFGNWSAALQEAGL